MVLGLYWLKSTPLVLPQLAQDGVKSFLRDEGARCRPGPSALFCSSLVLAHIRMALDTAQFLGNIFWRENEVHTAGIDGAARHAIVLGRNRIPGRR